ncbi:hypothetical protein SAMN05444920_12272 [Nonomuraea solani]|uniref:Secreted protein n=1 Tax=Nonomuraea solani TaxID=1144553 RepID=A0A1H6EXI6_9ACTN|nr:hypothetical protein [Nonomuraea solani]SEH01821.1 hypothetical protein SAMN05444920_12272 [Nonomuraea solani]
MRGRLRAALAIVASALSVLVLGTQPAWADYDIKGCKVSYGYCETGAIIPHNSELWVIARFYVCGGGAVEARLRDYSTGEIVDTFFVRAGGDGSGGGVSLPWPFPPDWPGGTPACNSEREMVYGLQYRHWYGLEVDGGAVAAAVWICNMTYDPRNGRTC